jgi:hypothetical protein
MRKGHRELRLASYAEGRPHGPALAVTRGTPVKASCLTRFLISLEKEAL